MCVLCASVIHAALMQASSSREVATVVHHLFVHSHRSTVHSQRSAENVMLRFFILMSALACASTLSFGLAQAAPRADVRMVATAGVLGDMQGLPHISDSNSHEGK